MSTDVDAASRNEGRAARPTMSGTPTLEARNLVKTFGHVVGLANVSLKLYPGEVLAIIGDNGAGKSTLIKCLSGALTPDEGEILVDGAPVVFKSPVDARLAGIETVFQTLAVAPALDIASNLYLGREERSKGPVGKIFRMLDTRGMREAAKNQLSDLGIGTIQDITQKVETLSGGQRQAVAVARAAAFGSKVVILDEPTAALGVRESGQVLALVKRLRDRGMPVILISHNMPQVFEVADRIHIQRLGRCAGVITPRSHTMEEAVAIMTGATTLDETSGRADGAAGDEGSEAGEAGASQDGHRDGG
jgi:fructose transport system ATP-binding protein